MDESHSTLVIETVVVSMAVAVGAVYTADAWPSPDQPLIWMGAAAGVFVVYAMVAAVRDLRKMLRQQAAPEEQGAASAPEAAPAQAQANAQAPTPAVAADASQSLVLGAPSEEATEFHSVDELRAETADDSTYADRPTVPLFAESSMYSTEELAAGARELAEGQEAQPQPAETPATSDVEHEEES